MKKAIFLSLLSALVLGSCVKPVTNSSNNGSSIAAESETLDPIVTDENLDKDNQPAGDIHSDLQYKYLCDEWTSIKTYVPETNASGKNPGNLSTPRGLILPFEDVDDADEYYVEISKDKTFEHSKIVTSKEKSYAYQSAEIGVRYFYRAATSEEALSSAPIKNKSSALIAPRNIEVGGVVNFRDIGGWKTSLVEGGRIKQGLYYRCGEFNHTNAVNSKNITAEGKELVKELGIKVDIDMRDEYRITALNGVSPASSDDWELELVNASIPSSTESRRFAEFADVYKTIFEKIADADKAPIALHCANGADRTGIVCFFLLALLGASEEDCSRDYSFTRFAGERDVDHTVEFDGWMNATKALEGDTLAEKMKNHLLSKGIAEEKLEHIREIFIDGYHAA
ncbi:MAG: tyrosine-protein phosphatase [Bacilli bacterium]|nr:tyrosine-protein phosphatase [Bacilli bacterium]